MFAAIPKVRLYISTRSCKFGAWVTPLLLNYISVEGRKAHVMCCVHDAETARRKDWLRVCVVVGGTGAVVHPGMISQATARFHILTARSPPARCGSAGCDGANMGAGMPLQKVTRSSINETVIPKGRSTHATPTR
jgi:hypothetical protein